MDKVYKFSKIYLPDTWYLIGIWPVFILAIIIFSFFTTNVGRNNTILFLLVFVVLFVVVSQLMKLLYKYRSCIKIHGNVISFFGILKKWNLEINSIISIDEKQGNWRPRPMMNPGGLGRKFGFTIKTKNTFYTVPYEILGYQEFLQDLKSINTAILLTSPTNAYILESANKIIIEDNKLYNAGSKTSKIIIYVVLLIIVLFAVLVFMQL